MNNKPSVLLISIDALKPEFVFESKRIGVNVPNIKKYFVENGTYASKGVKSVFPNKFTFDKSINKEGSITNRPSLFLY